MKKIIYIFALMLGIASFFNCEENDNTPAITEIDYVGFESGFTIGSDPIGTASQEVRIATSTTANTDRTYNIIVDTDLTTANPLAYTVPATVTVPANSNIGIFSVDVVGENINSSGEDILVIQFTSEEENLFTSGPITLKLKQVCPNPELIIDITFDQYPEEVYWRILDADNNTVFESITENGDDPWGTYEGATEGSNETRAVCLQPGTYTFEMYDKFSDGGGPFSLTIDGIEVFNSDGKYGFTISTQITIP